jgi:hypothetical protein
MHEHELDKLLAATGNLRKAADSLALQLQEISRRLARLESKEDWPAIRGALRRAGLDK